MISKSKKIIFNIIFSACIGFCALGVACLFGLNKSDAFAETSFPTEGTLEVCDGISLKLNEHGGMRFAVKMNKTTFDTVKTNDADNAVSLTVIVGPKAGFSTYTDYAYRAENLIKIDIDENKLFTSGNDGYYYANACVVDMKEANRKLDYTAVAYVVSGGTAIKESVINDNASGSFYNVANKAVLTTDSASEILSLSSYSWLGEEAYPINVTNIERYNNLVEKINSGVDFSAKKITIEAFDMTNKTELASGKSLPSTAAFKNDIELSVDNIEYGSDAEPVPSVNAYHGESTVTYAYSKEENGAYGAWSDIVDKTVGTYYVKASVPEGFENGAKYQAAEKTASFSIVKASANKVTFDNETVALHCGDILPEGATATFGTVEYTYSEDNVTFKTASEFGELTEGTYYVKASVADTANYPAAEKVMPFTVAHSYSESVDGTITTNVCSCGTKVVSGEISYDPIYLNVSDDGTTVNGTGLELDLSSVYSGNQPAELSLNGSDYSGIAVDGGVINLVDAIDASVYGQQEVGVTIVDGKATYNLTVNVLFITKYIATQGELRSVKTISAAIDGGGYFVLTENITFTPKYNAGNATGSAEDWYCDCSNCKVDYTIGTLAAPFNGTIDGNGHIISGIDLNGAYGKGFITAMGENGVLKNVNFVNVRLQGQSSIVFSAKAGGLVENVYVQLYSRWTGNIEKTGVFAADLGEQKLVLKNVTVDFRGTYYHSGETAVNKNTLLGRFASKDQLINVVVIGVPDLWKNAVLTIGDVTGADGVTVVGTDVATEEVDLDGTVLDLGAAVENGAVVYKGTGTEIDISSVYSGSCNNAPVTLNGSYIFGVNVINGKFTLNPQDFTAASGNIDLAVTISDGNGSVKVITLKNLLVVTKVITDKDGLRSIKTISNALNGGGYYMLGANITFTPNYWDPNGNASGSIEDWYCDCSKCKVDYTIGTSTVPFNGTIDGNGYTISGIDFNSAYGYGFINYMGANGVLKNVAFVKVRLQGQTSIVFAAEKGGLVENVYVQIHSRWTTAEGRTGVFAASPDFDEKLVLKNVVVDLTETKYYDQQTRGGTILGRFASSDQLTNVVVLGVTDAWKNDVALNGDTAYVTYLTGGDNGVTFPATGWDETYWTVDGTNVTFKTK